MRPFPPVASRSRSCREGGARGTTAPRQFKEEGPARVPSNSRLRVYLLEEVEHTLCQLGRRLRVVVGETAIREKMAVTGVEEEFAALYGTDQFSGGVEVPFLHPLVPLHHVDLQRDALGPWSPELFGREGRGEEERALRAESRLGERLRRHHAE